jgi:hypothetical protein
MRSFSLSHVFAAVAALGVLLGIGVWHPGIGICVALVVLPVVLLRLSRNFYVRAFVIAIPIALVLMEWMSSYEFSLSYYTATNGTAFKVCSHRGQIFFFRYVGYTGTPYLYSDSLYGDPEIDHWRDWPGFHQEVRYVSLPGLEFSHAKFIPPMLAQWKSEHVEVVSLSYWLVLILVCCFLIVGARRLKPAIETESASPLLANS